MFLLRKEPLMNKCVVYLVRKKPLNIILIYIIMKILHISFHNGCHNEITYIMNKLGHQLSFLAFNDGTKGKYNIGHKRAEKYWNKHKNYFNRFDLIITSDTAPISRVFIQNGWEKPLIVWINNRFDYCDQATNDCNFPDDEYYELFKEANHKKNICIFGYTEFEHLYCERKGIDIRYPVIKPTGKNVYGNYIKTEIENKDNTFFIGPYHNDNIMINLMEKLKELNINCYNGRYNGPQDLAEFKGIVHIPYAWSNYALFECVQMGIQYFIPSKEFLFELKKDKDFFWSPPYNDKDIEYSEWYNEDNKNMFIYFNSWDDLRVKITITNLEKRCNMLKEIGEKHEDKYIKLWEDVLQF